MNFKKVYKEFKAARVVHDVEKMSDIFLSTNTCVETMVRSGKANKIPPEAHKILKWVIVPFYTVTKLLSEGNGNKAKYYLMAIKKHINKGIFHQDYLFGRAFYLTGDYPKAIEYFMQYEKAREAQDFGLDELNIFYLANSFALTRDFQMAATLYEGILKIKSDFPEAKNNLELALRGSTENFSYEVKSLWNFCDWHDVPIFINARDRLGVLKKLIDWLLEAGYRNLIILDNASTYPPLLEYYDNLKQNREGHVQIVMSNKNFGYKALWRSGILELMKISTPYVYTDPDVLPIERCPKNFVEQLMKILDSNHEIRKVGLGLVYDDITFSDKDKIQQIQSRFYDGTEVGENIFHVQVDTTFALYSNVRHYNLRFSLRTMGDLMAYHLPWYFDYNNLPEDEKYYMEHADKNSVTTVKKFID